jgi:RNase P subunit RPR2
MRWLTAPCAACNAPILVPDHIAARVMRGDTTIVCKECTVEIERIEEVSREAKPTE